MPRQEVGHESVPPARVVHADDLGMGVGEARQIFETLDVDIVKAPSEEPTVVDREHGLEKSVFLSLDHKSVEPASSVRR